MRSIKVLITSYFDETKVEFYRSKNLSFNQGFFDEKCIDYDSLTKFDFIVLDYSQFLELNFDWHLIKMRKLIIVNCFEPEIKRIKGVKIYGIVSNIKELLRIIEHLALGGGNRRPENKSRSKKRMTFIGAGITNLYTAYQAIIRGYKVSIYDANINPSKKKRGLIRSSTLGGQDARIFSFTEARHHFKKKNQSNPFTKGIEDKGRLCLSSSNLCEKDQRWIRDFEALPKWAGDYYHEDIVGYNKESYKLWNDFFTKDAHISPASFGLNQSLIRIYDSEENYRKGIESSKMNQCFVREVGPEELIEKNPCFQKPSREGFIYKSFLVKGFSLNLHKLVSHLIRLIENGGGSFFWESNVDNVIWKRDIIQSLVLNNGSQISDEIIVVSPGAYGEGLLSELKMDNYISSVIGMWLNVPNVGLTTPIKLSRAGVSDGGACQSANVITGSDKKGRSRIYISSGHGFIGFNQHIDSSFLKELQKGVLDVASRYFSIDIAAPDLENPFSYCVRPWTHSCLGIFKKIKAEKGHVFVVGGHNTGGFAQTPSVAKAIFESIEKGFSKMETLYNPARSELFSSLC